MPRPSSDSVSRWFILSSHTTIPHLTSTSHRHEHFSLLAGRDIVPEPPSTISSSSQHQPKFPIRGNASLPSHNNTHRFQACDPIVKPPKWLAFKISKIPSGFAMATPTALSRRSKSSAVWAPSRPAYSPPRPFSRPCLPAV